MLKVHMLHYLQHIYCWPDGWAYCHSDSRAHNRTYCWPDGWAYCHSDSRAHGWADPNSIM